MKGRKTLAQRENELQEELRNHTYQMLYWKDFDFSILSKIPYTLKKTGHEWKKVNECIIMADTETSKNPKHTTEVYENHIVAWTISIRAASANICTLYGTRPTEHIKAIEKIHNSLKGDTTYIYYHNMSYDWCFLRRFYMAEFGEPERQLNTKSLYPINIEFGNGVVLRDSLILAQRSLERWAKDMDVEHKKAVNEWVYQKIRNQGGSFTDEELEYIEHDTLAGVECLDALKKSINSTVGRMPYTSTGIVRKELRAESKKKENRGRTWFEKNLLTYEQYLFAEEVYHGGFTHQNRFWRETFIDDVYTDGQTIQCYDIASSYPFCLLSEKYPAGEFVEYPDCKPADILKATGNYAFMFTLELYDVHLTDRMTPMPYLQYSKARTINETVDNGRILQADFISIPITEIDLELIARQYTWNAEYSRCTNVIVAHKDFLPRWFTDFVYGLFQQKTQLKGGDPVLYALAKSKLNSCYGMCCQHVMQDDIQEDYETGEYITIHNQLPEDYEKYCKNRNSFLPYQIGIWCTAYACRNLFALGACVDKVGQWIYSDTDSCFAWGWNMEKLDAYNKERVEKLKARGYDGVEHNGRKYYLGIVELDKECHEFCGIHSKCYCYRDKNSGELKITVAGVPKNGVKCLKDDIRNFKVGFVFPGTQTGKLTHSYIYNKIHKDKYGNEIGDSINLQPCDYLINSMSTLTLDDILFEEVEVFRDYEQ